MNNRFKPRFSLALQWATSTAEAEISGVRRCAVLFSKSFTILTNVVVPYSEYGDSIRFLKSAQKPDL